MAGGRVIVASPRLVTVVDLASDERLATPIDEDRGLAPRRVRSGEATWVASPVTAEALDVVAGRKSDPHRAFAPEALADTASWRSNPPRNVLLSVAGELVHVAIFGGSAGLAWHRSSGVVRRALPPGRYEAGAVAGSRVYLSSIDRAAYRTTLHVIETSSGAPELAAS